MHRRAGNPRALTEIRFPGPFFTRAAHKSAEKTIPDRVGDGFLGPFPPVAQSAVADVLLGRDLGQRDAFQPVAADQLGLPFGEDAAAHGGGQHEVGVPPGQVRAVAPDGEAAAAAGVVSVGAGQGLPGPPGRPAQPGRQRDLLQVVEVQAAQGGQEPGQHLGLQIRRVAAVRAGQAGDRAAQAGHRDPGQADHPGRVAGPGAADQPGPHPVAGAGAGGRVQQQDPQLIEGDGPVRQALGQLRGVHGQRLRAGGQQPERGIGGVEGIQRAGRVPARAGGRRGAGRGGVVIHAGAPGEGSGRERSPIQPAPMDLPWTCGIPRAGLPCTSHVPGVDLRCT